MNVATKPAAAMQLLTADQLAALLHVGRTTVYRWAHDGVIPSIRIGPRTVRFDPDAVRDALDQQPVRGG